jgi:hypothetical protein
MELDVIVAPGRSHDSGHQHRVLTPPSLDDCVWFLARAQDENYVRYKNELIVNATTADLSGAITGSVRNTDICEGS